LLSRGDAEAYTELSRRLQELTVSATFEVVVDTNDMVRDMKRDMENRYKHQV
jgi:TusA-related sulfurtransferase